MLFPLRKIERKCFECIGLLMPRTKSSCNKGNKEGAMEVLTREWRGTKKVLEKGRKLEGGTLNTDE